VELLQCGVLDSTDNSRLVHLAQRASFYRVLRFLHAQSRRYDLVFLAHLQDPAQKVCRNAVSGRNSIVRQ